MVSYAESPRRSVLGIECKVGIASRAVRVVIISIGLFLADLTISGHDLAVLKGAIYVLAVMSLFTISSASSTCTSSRRSSTPRRPLPGLIARLVDPRQRSYACVAGDRVDLLGELGELRARDE